MSKPRLLDLFCCAGGAGMGYHQAGFDVVGVDIIDQKHYPFEFIQADVLTLSAEFLAGFDAIHASPPCQKFSKTAAIHRKRANSKVHLDLIEPTREMLRASGKPYIIENVVGAPLNDPHMLCGTMFGLKVFRHRLFESNVFMWTPPHPSHDGSTGSHRGYSTARSGRNGYICVAGHNFERDAASEAMGIDWMPARRFLSQAIPPAYTKWLGGQLLSAIRQERAAA